MRHLFTLLALTALLTAPALAYQVDDTHSPGLADVILEQATAEALPMVLVAYEVTTTKAPATPGITSATSPNACASRVMAYAEIVECRRLRPPAWQPVRPEHRHAFASLDTTMRDTRSQTWPIHSPRQSTSSSLATSQ